MPSWGVRSSSPEPKRWCKYCQKPEPSEHHVCSQMLEARAAEMAIADEAEGVTNRTFQTQADLADRIKNIARLDDYMRRLENAIRIMRLKDGSL